MTDYRRTAGIKLELPPRSAGCVSLIAAVGAPYDIQFGQKISSSHSLGGICLYDALKAFQELPATLAVCLVTEAKYLFVV